MRYTRQDGFLLRALMVEEFINEEAIMKVPNESLKAFLAHHTFAPNLIGAELNRRIRKTVCSVVWEGQVTSPASTR